MSNTTLGQPTKSILKQNHTINSNGTSWFSKFNNTTIENTTPATAATAAVATASPLPRINSLFGSFRKQQQSSVDTSQHSATSQEDIAVIAELVPKEIRRVRFPVTDMTTEFLFKKEDLITDPKKPIVMEPVHIQTSAQFLSLYESVCRKKQEPTLDLFISTLISQPQATFLTKLDLTNQPIDRQNIAPLADMMCIEFGLRELVLNHCGLENDAIKILMQSLLEHDKIKQLSLADNPKLSTAGFKYISIYVKGSCQLTSLDLSYTQPDKKSIQYITAATLKQDVSSPSPSLYNLVLNGCNLRTPLLETLATGIRKPTSSLRQLSIRSNRIANTASALAIGVMLRDYDDNLYGLERLYLDNNDFSQGGIQYIAQALRRNQSLRYLSMCECRIDAKGCVLMGEALKYNQYLERLDIGYNPLCTPNMDGITLIRQALNVNRSLKDLCLAETGLGTEAAIALAECLPENHSLVRLDLSRNPQIQIAGLMAISVSIKMNSNITFIDINIPNEDKDMVEIHNGILAACTKNAQLKKVAQDTTTAITTNVNNPLVTKAQATARLTLQERLAAVTKGKNSKQNLSASSSEVTPPPLPQRRKAETDNDALLIQQAFDQVGSLEDILSGRIPKEEQTEEGTMAVFDRCKEIQTKISLRIPEIADASHLELLLAINDRLTMAIQSFNENHITKAVQAIDIAVVQQIQQEDEKLSSSFEIGDDDDDDDDEYDEALNDEDELERDNHLKELRSEIEAEESAAFLNAKKKEIKNENKLEEKASTLDTKTTELDSKNDQ